MFHHHEAAKIVCSEIEPGNELSSHISRRFWRLKDGCVSDGYLTKVCYDFVHQLNENRVLI
jgi:hypothetical protein